MSSKIRRAYIVQDSDSESSKAGKSSETDEMENICHIANHKKKNVSYFKYEPIDQMASFDLQIAFENLHGEAKEAFTRMASNK